MADYKQTPIGKIPEDWEVVRLGEIAEVVSGYAFPLKYQGKISGKYPFIKVNDLNITKKYVTKAENFVDDRDLKALGAKVFPPNTIIFPKIGMALYLNKFRILKTWGTFDNNIAGVIPKEHDPEFLYYYFLGKVDLKQLSNITTTPSIKKSTLERLFVPLPPLEEQRKIAEILSTVDKAIEKVDEEIEKTQRLKKGLMQELLTKGINLFVVEREKIINAVRKAYENRDHEFGREENLVNHLVDYLREEFGSYDIDVEVEKDAKGHRPDIIIHKRNTDINLFAIEVKKRENFEQIKKDIGKLENLMLDEYKYCEAIFIGFNIRNPERVLNLSNRVNFVLVTPEGEIKVKARERELKDTEIGRIPKEWKVVKLGEIGFVKTGPFGSQLKKKDLTTKGFKIYEQENVIYKDFNRGNDFIDSKKFESLKSFEVLPGDILITRVGSIGYAAVVPNNIIPGIIGSRLLRIRLSKSLVNAYYLEIVLMSSLIQHRIAQNAHGATRKGLNTEIVKNLKIPLPPLPEQQKIAEILSTVDKKLELLRKRKEKLERIKKGLMNDLLTGRRRVKL